MSSRGEGIPQQTTFSLELQHQLLPGLQPACPADFGLTSLHGHVSPFLKISLCEYT